MSSVSGSAVSRQKERKGSFFKLIDSFASEICTLKKEMGNKTKPVTTEEQKTDALIGLGEEVGGLFLQAPPCSGISSSLAGVRDSGYDSPHRRLSVLDRLLQTHSVWLQLSLSYTEGARMLQSQPPGSFIVRRSVSLQRKVISLRMEEDAHVPVKDFPVKESQYTFSLEGSGLSFADLFRLVAFCCISRDVLPFTLKLPEAVASARTSAHLEEISKLGTGFWDTQRRKRSSSSGTVAPNRPPPPAQRPLSVATFPGRPRLRTRTPSELDCCRSNGALCFINPLFIKIHQPEHGSADPENGSADPENGSADPENGSADPENGSVDPENSSTDPENGSVDSENGSTDPEPKDELISSSVDDSNKESVVQVCIRGGSPGPGSSEEPKGKSQSTDAAPRSPPPRPPPPRFTQRHSAPLIRQHSMPEKIPWINVSKEKMEERGSSLLSRLGSSLSISPSSSPPKRLGIISSPISIPRPSLPLSFPSLSSSPRRSKTSPSSSQEDAQYQLALEDQTIEKAVIRAKQCQRNATAIGGDASPTQARKQTREGGACVEGGGGQRLSDMSLSTDSSDSLDFSQSSAFFLPPLHDPSPPTEADFNTHLPLSLPLPHLPYNSMEEDDDDDDDEDEEEPDYGVSLESDQDLTMVPPGHRAKRRPSALLLQKALRGHLRKMSGVFNSLLTPEKRAIRKVLELSRDKGSYFGCLVQDYLSYMGEGAETQAWQGYASSLELLQTLRQFITQMKSYLRQSSELEPPIESLIPEDQIDRVLEKAMHKCVLKPLRVLLSAALQEYQVRSGAWQELKENLALAKARHPQEMGVADTPPPDTVAIEKIKHKFHNMCKLYSPEKKVSTLLRVCKLIYTVMEEHSGRLYGADDFLPMLTYVLAQCDMPQLDNEILYMMELLDPSLLHGEGGYYLTSAYGAMSLIKNFQEEQAARVLSCETRDTLHQWHRRRTMQRSAPTVDDFQNYLRVALQELDSGCTAKTLQVRPYATAEEVCRLCAAKFGVSQPAAYGLFLLTGGDSQQLAPDTHPQKIKAELHSRQQATPFHFLYRRLDPPVTSDLDRPDAAPSAHRALSPSLSLSLPPPTHLNASSISV